jgi:hypothetical protein
MVPIALTLATTAASAAQAWTSGSYEMAIADRNYKQAKILSEDALARGEQRADANRRQVGQKIGAQKVGLAASGVDVGSGMALNIIGDTALLGELDTQIIRQNADREAKGYDSQAANFKAQKKAAKSSRLWNTAGVILGGAADAAGQANKSFPNFFT